ncbi:MAG TPA: hypothetical protein VIF12_05800, partial [Micavibrio sp.]
AMKLGQLADQIKADEQEKKEAGEPLSTSAELMEEMNDALGSPWMASKLASYKAKRDITTEELTQGVNDMIKLVEGSFNGDARKATGFLRDHGNDPEISGMEFHDFVTNKAASYVAEKTQPTSAIQPQPVAYTSETAQKPKEISGYSDFIKQLDRRASDGNNTAKVVSDRLKADASRSGSELVQSAARDQVRMLDSNPQALTAILAGIDNNPNISAKQFNDTWDFARAKPENLRDFVTDPEKFAVRIETQDKREDPKTGEQKSRALTAAEKNLDAVLKAFGVDAEGGTRPGFDGFKKRVEKYPELKTALLSMNGGDKKKAGEFMNVLKDELDKDSDLFVNVNNLIDKNQKNLGKMAKEMVNDPKGAFDKLHTAMGFTKAGNWLRENITFGGLGGFLGNMMEALPGFLESIMPMLEKFGGMFSMLKGAFGGKQEDGAGKKPDTQPSTTPPAIIAEKTPTTPTSPGTAPGASPQVTAGTTPASATGSSLSTATPQTTTPPPVTPGEEPNLAG